MKIQTLKMLALSLAIAAFMILVSAFYKIRYDAIPIEKSIRDAPDMYRSYLTSNPDISSHQFYGYENASITFVAFTDVNSPSSKRFMQQTFRMLEKDYIHTGIIRFYHKPYITLGDIEEKNENFDAAMTLGCLGEIRNEEYFAAYFEIMEKGIAETTRLLKKYNFSIEDYNNCMYSKESFDNLYRDALEVEGLSIVGLGQRFYIGIGGAGNTIIDGNRPYREFQQAIQQQEIIIGQ